MVYFKHKKSGQIITMEQLKEMGRYREIIIANYNVPLFDGNTWNALRKEEYEYTSGYIPFSDDFEVLGNHEIFTVEELIKIYDFLMDKEFYESKIIDKIVREIRGKEETNELR